MANPNWIKGGTSPNPAGRGKMKSSSRTVKGMVERFIKKNVTPNKLQVMYDKLTAKDKLEFLAELLPYVMPKQSTLNVKAQINSLSDGELDELYNRIAGVPDPSFLDYEETPMLLPGTENSQQ